MSHWVKLTSKTHGNPVYVNLDRAATVKGGIDGSIIVIPDANQGDVEVKEAPERIFKMVRINAQRT